MHVANLFVLRWEPVCPVQPRTCVSGLKFAYECAARDVLTCQMHSLYLVLRAEKCSAATLLLPSDCELLDPYHPESARECVLRSAHRCVPHCCFV